MLAGIGLFFTGCEGAYVTSEPAYAESVRPARPSETHIWIDGDWQFNRRSHSYTHSNGYWEKPRPGRSHVSGHWNTTPRGHTWTKGHYQRR